MRELCSKDFKIISAGACESFKLSNGLVLMACEVPK